MQDNPAITTLRIARTNLEILALASETFEPHDPSRLSEKDELLVRGIGAIARELVSRIDMAICSTMESESDVALYRRSTISEANRVLSSLAPFSRLLTPEIEKVLAPLRIVPATVDATGRASSNEEKGDWLPAMDSNHD